MGSTDNFFEATGPNFAGFYAPPDDDDTPVFTFGARLFGRTAGLLAFRGSDGPNQQNSYTLTAGVMGSSNDATGVAGTSLKSPASTARSRIRRRSRAASSPACLARR